MIVNREGSTIRIEWTTKTLRVNSTYRSGQGRFYKDKGISAQHKALVNELSVQMNLCGVEGIRGDHAVAVRFSMHPGGSGLTKYEIEIVDLGYEKRAEARCDIDAGIKAVLDILKKAKAMPDDRAVETLAVNKF